MTAPDESPRSHRARRPQRLQTDDRADVPMRIAPLLLIGLILVVLAIIGGALL